MFELKKHFLTIYKRKQYLPFTKRKNYFLVLGNVKICLGAKQIIYLVCLKFYIASKDWK